MRGEGEGGQWEVRCVVRMVATQLQAQVSPALELGQTHVSPRCGRLLNQGPSAAASNKLTCGEHSRVCRVLPLQLGGIAVQEGTRVHTAAVRGALALTLALALALSRAL